MKVYLMPEQDIDNEFLHSAGSLSMLALEKWIPTIIRLFGAVIMLLAIASYMTNMTLIDLLSYVEKLFSFSFVLLFAPLILFAGYAVVLVNRTDVDKEQKAFWFEIGQQSANGMSTLALTFTLLGISVGIGTLSKQSLTPETVNDVIGVLTQQFSMAFMTTVVGLPAATLSRALLSISMVKPAKTRPYNLPFMHHQKE
ncbi:MAG: hypothetical protein ACI9IT_001465 [Glaciecola sp.]|jgi:hypothetical protein